MHALQTLIVAALVPCCVVYALWKLMPSAARSALAASILRAAPRLPASIDAPLRKATQGASGCGCDGCDSAAKPAASTQAQTITFHKRLKR